MLLELIIALIVGIIAGTFTGIAPGIHINLVAALLLASLTSLGGAPLIVLAVFIVAMSITHTFLDFIPSIFLGAPEEDTFLSILPGHEFLQEGHGYKAAILTLYGSLFSLVIILIFAPLFVVFLPSLYEIIKNIIPFILIFISLYLIFRENKFILSIVVFFLAGFLGLATFNLPLEEPLLPLLSGLFGLSSLIISLQSKKRPEKQKIVPLKEIMLTKTEFKKASLASIISAPICSFLPGIGSGHAATLGSEIIPQGRKGFLFLVGSINTTIMALSFVTVYAIGKARSGTAAAVQNILHQISLEHLIIIMFTVLLSGIFAFVLGIKIAKFFALSLNKINYKKLTIFVIFVLFLINILFSGWVGLLVFIISAALGIFCILSNSRRINLMGSLIIPAVVYYLVN